MKPERVQPGSPDYPPALLRGGGAWTPPDIHALGNVTLLRQPLTGLFCSAKCPGDIILKLYDHVKTLRDQGATVISGFHSPMEKECLRILLRGNQPIVICPARSLENMRLPADWRKPLANGRLLILSCIADGQARASADIAERRNEFVTALASEILIAYAAPGGRLESLARRLETQGRRITRLMPAPS